MSRFKNRSRKIAREAYWERHNRETYTCPDCGRSENQIVGKFEVHHKNGEPMDNRPENQIGLCRLCHNLREGKKPNIENIKQLRSEIGPKKSGTDGLTQPSVYLAGSMHRTKHDRWRSSIAEPLESGEFTIDGPININSPTEVTEFCHGAGPVNGIAGSDMELINHSDAIVAYFDKKEQVGTLTELVYAVTQGMPALVLFDKELVNLSDESNIRSLSGGVDFNMKAPTYWFLINFLSGHGWSGPTCDVDIKAVPSKDWIKTAFIDWSWHDKETRRKLRNRASNGRGDNISLDEMMTND